MGRVSVITGGAGGMGLATAKIVGRDHMVVLCDVRQDRLDDAAATLKDLGVDATVVNCDVTDRGAVDRLAERDRMPFIPVTALKRDPHLEMHTRGG